MHRGRASAGTDARVNDTVAARGCGYKGVHRGRASVGTDVRVDGMVAVRRCGYQGCTEVMYQQVLMHA